MDKKSQALVISSWILVILTVVAVSLGHRVSMELRLSRYHRDSLKALYLANAGIELAIAELAKDAAANSYDSLNENWARNEDAFREISPSANPNEFFTVSYEDVDTGLISYGARDEERKIDINQANGQLLTTLFTECGVDATKAAELANDIRIWTGKETPPADYAYYDNLGYSVKAKPLVTVEEIALIKGIEELDRATLRAITSLITVHGSNTININTASQTILEICALSVADPSAIDEARNLATLIIAFRQNGQSFESVDGADIKAKLNIQPTDPKNSIIDALTPLLSSVSNTFLIEAEGNSNSVTKKITAIYNRDPDKKVVSWQEN